MKLLHHIKTERPHCLRELPFRIYFYMPIESLMIVSFYPAPMRLRLLIIINSNQQ